MSYTSELRDALHEIGWTAETELSFYTRLPNGKRKKVRGKFCGLFHKPGTGFLIQLRDVHWLGSYWPFSLSFKTRRIEWTDEGFALAFARAMEMARQRVPRLTG